MSQLGNSYISQEGLITNETMPALSGGKKRKSTKPKKITTKPKKNTGKKMKGGNALPPMTTSVTSSISQETTLPSQNVIMPVSVPDMPPPPSLNGGAKKTQKTKKARKLKGGECSSNEDCTDQDGGKKKGKGKGKGKGKKGGALMDDLQNLAVPFAILLAKQGLESMFSKDKKTQKTAKKSSSKQSGGDCGCGGTVATVGAPLAGGKPTMKQKFMSLTDTIDNFLQKY